MAKGVQKICGGNTCSAYERIREKVEEDTNIGISTSRSMSLSWVIADLMTYCYEEGLSFEHVLKMGKKSFEWDISRECVKCKRKMSPDDGLESEGCCAGCETHETGER